MRLAVLVVCAEDQELRPLERRQGRRRLRRLGPRRHSAARPPTSGPPRPSQRCQPSPPTPPSPGLLLVAAAVAGTAAGCPTASIEGGLPLCRHRQLLICFV